MTGVRGFVGAVFVFGLVASCGGPHQSPAVTVTGDGAEIVIPDGVDPSGISIGDAGKRLHDPALESVGRGWVAKPAGTTFAKPVTVRVPVSQAELAGYLARPQDLFLYTKGEGDGRFKRLPTRLVADGTMLEADVQHFSSFQVGLSTPDLCLYQGRKMDCTIEVCALSDLINSQDTIAVVAPPASDPKARAKDEADAACELAKTGFYAEAISSLGQLETDLVEDLGANLVTAGTYATIMGAIRNSEKTLLQIPTVDVTGSWVASLPIGGGLRTVAIQLLQRNDGTVMGYVFGAPAAGSLGRTVVSGKVLADQLHLNLEDADAQTTVSFAVDGTVSPKTADTPNGSDERVLQGTASDGTTTASIAWHTTSANLVEKRYTVFGAGLDDWLAVSLVTSEGTGGSSGGLISGGFLSLKCDIVGCSGDVFDLTQNLDGSATILVETRDHTQGSFTVLVTEDGSVSGTWASPPGTVPPNGSFVGYPAMGTTTAHAATMLARFGRLADDLERHADFLGYRQAGSYSPVSPYYLFDGRTAGDLLAALAGETHRFDLLQVRFSRFRNLATRWDPTQQATGPLSPSVTFQDTRSGAIGTVPLASYYDVDSVPPYDDLTHLVVIPGTDGNDDDIRIVGNQLVGRDLSLPLAPADIPAASIVPFGVHRAGATVDGTGEDHFTFRIPAASGDPSSPGPAVLAPTDLQVVFAAGGGSGQPADIVLSQTDRGSPSTPGIYLVVNTQLVPAWTTLPAFFAAGDAAHPMGTMAPELDPGNGDTVAHVVGLGVSLGFPGNLCPYWRLSDQARGQVIDMINRSPYPEQFVEPFVCNPDQAKAAPANLARAWPLQDANPEQSVKAIKFIRPTLDATPMYQYTTIDASGHETAPAPVWNLALRTANDGATRWVFTLGGDGTSTDVTASARIAVTPGEALLLIDFNSPDLPNATIYTAGTVGDPCDDGNPCTDDSLLAFGLCAHDSNSNPCFAGDFCYLDDACQDGACKHVLVSGQPVTRECDTANGFSCVAPVGCVLLQPPDQCHLPGVCDPATGQCSTPPKADGAACVLADSPCTVNTCQTGGCTAGAPVTCVSTSPCLIDGACNPSTGACEFQYALDTVQCNDIPVCMTGGHCAGGSCMGTAVACVSSNPCLVDGACNPATGACEFQNAPDTVECDDGHACTTGDHCSAGACVGTDVLCTADPCHLPGHCEPANGLCTEPTANPSAAGTPCDDNVPFTTNDRCLADATCAGNPSDCSATAPVGQVFAVNSISLGTSGTFGQGLDVDGNSATCSPSGNCSGGIDNLVAVLASTANSAIAAELATVTWGTVLMDFRNNAGPDQDFVLPLYAGRLDPRNGGCHFTAPDAQACDFTLPYYDLDASCAPMHRFMNAQIHTYDGNTGTLTAGGPGTAIPIVVPYHGQIVRGTVYDAQVSAHFVMDENQHATFVAPSIVAGAVRPADVVAVLDVLFPGSDSIIVYQNADDTLEITKGVARAMILGISPDIDTDNTGVPDAVSIAALFTAREANVGAFAKPCGTAADCNDGAPCTDDACDSVVGCLHSFNTSACDDGNECTADACVLGMCSGTPLTDGTSCALGACQAGTCTE